MPLLVMAVAAAVIDLRGSIVAVVSYPSGIDLADDAVSGEILDLV